MIALLATLLIYSYDQIGKEEVRLWEGIAENTFNQTQTAISNYLLQEDTRSFTEYRYYYIPETQLETSFALNVSPLAILPENNDNGLIGYFQINPDASLHTPYLPPKKDYHKLTDLKQRQELQANLKQITRSLQDDMKADRKGQQHAHDISTLPQPKTTAAATAPAMPTGDRSSLVGGISKRKANEKSRAKLYASPSKKERGQDMLEAEGAFAADEFKQEVVSNIAQYQTFQEQKAKILDHDTEEMSPAAISAPSIFTDPFRARLVGKDNIIFYRRIWVEQKMYVQGFVLNTRSFFSWAIKNAFAPSTLAGFSVANLEWENTLLAASQNIQANTTQILFERNLGYPLNQITYSINYSHLPALISRTFLNILTALLLFMVTMGLYIIYRSAAAQVVLSQKRQDFVAAITHELKTPLTSIRLYSEMLTEGWAENETKKKEYYGLISSESDRLSRLIENVLQLSRLEKKNYSYHLETKDPRPDFLTLAGEFKTFAEKHGFTFTTKIADNLPPITYDLDALKQVLYTLIDNSIKFTSDKDEKCIEMSLIQEKDKVIWAISDHGPGVEPKEQNKIFTKFYRTENEQTRKTKGTGIGLAMAKMLVEGMGASIVARNSHPVGLTIKLIFSLNE